MTRAAPAALDLPSLLPRLRALLAARLGLHFDERQDDRLTAALTRVAGPVSPERFLDQMELAPTRARLDALAAELTVGETFFFRHAEQFDALRFDLLPGMVRSLSESAQAEPGGQWGGQLGGPGRRLRALSAGCASGEEAYTLAITLHRAGLQAQGVDWEVLAVDLNPAALARAAAARYGEWSLRATPQEQRDLWLHRVDPGLWTPLPAIRERVRFAQRNLAQPDAMFWAPGSFDIIFCRNVLIYFEPTALRQAIRNLTGALAPGGALFLGHAETLRGKDVAQEAGLVLRQAHGCFFYRREPVEDARVWPLAWTSSSSPAPGVDAAPSAGAIPGSALSSGSGHGVAGTPSTPDAAGPEGDADQALLDEALQLIEAGQVEDGLRACARLITPGTPAALQAEGLFLHGLAMEERGQLPAAEWHHQRAAAKDAAFAFPHLRLGLLARRRGEVIAAHRELRRALELLDHESSERLRRFGGGFDRDDLRRLCRDEMQETRA
ncbi:protein-glutamate O-methyltransferase CheR [Mitsuaria sp. 7]|uniref:CheR family methyltransferase n=1 Tax=Mitsuaria sp. 7 TaxID=1658665 RepID=UPI000832B899|nr:CheR family methyltransferase [Mitsuaria sp. 7]